ncbi:MAG: hypothetical protein RL757_2344 [Bacteroidota bacterium]|jgi:lipopolysaccharide biosynthesis regulator YciM
MGKSQWIAIASAVALFMVLFFGCPTQSKEQVKAEGTRQVNAMKGDKAVDIESVMRAAAQSINPQQRESIAKLEEELQKTVDEPSKKAENIATLKKIAGAWHDAQHDEVAALYAQQIAEEENTDAAWEIAGANFYLALQAAKTPEMQDFLGENAVKAFESAISLNPAKMEHKVNLAVCYAEHPPKDNPMKGTLLLLDMVKESPDNPMVNFQLGRLGIKTGQFDKAIKRLEVVLKANPNDRRANCLIAEAYEGLGDASNAATFAQKCKTLNK